jgi:hypothetical protein
MSGTYAVEPDGTGTMTINFTPTNAAATCGASTGAFNIVILSLSQVEFVSSGQMMAALRGVKKMNCSGDSQG